MKQLLAGIIFILVIGLAGFLYRNEVERPWMNTSPNVGGSANGVACTDEAKICPDGSAVGRTGPHCSFAPCPPPSAELTSGSTTLAFVLPAGYATTATGSGQSLIATYAQSGTNGSLIHVYDYTIPVGSTASQVMIANTVFTPSGLTATSTSEFTQVVEGKNMFSVVQIGRFEGQVQTAYYLPRSSDVLRFDIVERNVTDWTDPNLDVSTLPQHRAIQQMLATLQVSP
jgi:hypothetical protein